MSSKSGFRWFHQCNGYGLGNFITVTAGLNCPVYFDDKELEDVYRGSFVILEEKPTHPPVNEGFSLPKRKLGESDYDAWRRFFNVDADPFVPFRAEKTSFKVAFFHGCYASFYRERKNVIAQVSSCLNLIDAIGVKTILLGSVSDKQYWDTVRIPLLTKNLLGKTTLRQALEELSKCSYFVSNDTGLYHAAAAMGIPGRVYWRDTDFQKNKAPSTNLEHIHVVSPA